MSHLTSMMKTPKQLTFVVVAAIVFCTAGSVNAIDFGGPGGTWPKSWPRKLEPLREQAWTWVGGQVMYTRYDIPFADRDEFESVWPHLLKLKSKGASLTLVNRSHYYGGGSGMTGGVIIIPPLDGHSEGPWSVTRIFLKVDGKIVDLNRIRLPADTPIIDERFKDGKEK
jgi:hypothetical protein